jgi:hypoxanthine phosphoribosyltransferase
MVNLIGKIVLNSERTLLKVLGATFLDLDDVYGLVDVLAGNVVKGNFKPELIVGMLNGGYYPAKLLSEILQIPCTYMNLNRTPHKFCGLDLEDLLAVNRFTNLGKKIPKLQTPFKGVGRYNRILLVDEDLVTGRTFKMAEEVIRKNSISVNIKRATIFTFPGREVPDYFVEENGRLVFNFSSKKKPPWFPYSPYYESSKIQNKEQELIGAH